MKLFFILQFNVIFYLIKFDSMIFCTAALFIIKTEKNNQEQDKFDFLISEQYIYTQWQTNNSCNK